MHIIPTKPEKPKKRYEGKKGKLIHLNPAVFDFLSAVAKRKNSNLKEYIEELCLYQAKAEAEKGLKQYDKT